MALAFGWPEDYLVGAVVDLIRRGLMKARVDSAKGTLVARKQEPRIEAFRNALEQGEKMQRRAMASQLRYVSSSWSRRPASSCRPHGVF